MTHDHKIHTLPSGLSVLLVPMEGVKSVTVLSLVGTGSRFEDTRVSGISHFLEHMVFKGTTKYPNAKVLASVIDEIGAEFNAFTSKEYTGYYVKCASEFTRLALDVVSDMLLQPLLQTEDIEREKGVIVEEIHMYEDSPSRHISNVFDQLMFAGSSLGRDIIGTEASVRSLNREDFLHHLKQWYGLKNVVLCLAGDKSVVEDPALLLSIQDSFSKDTEDRLSTETPSYIADLKGSPIAQGKRVRVMYKDTQQAHFVFGLPGLKRSDPDRYALSLAGTLLGGNMSSRLFTEVREKRGLCYYVHADVDHYHDCGVFGASAGVDPKRVEEAVKVVKEQLLLIASDSGEGMITDEEVEKAKSHVIGSTTLEFEDSHAVASLYAASKLLQNNVETIDEKLHKIKRVTPDEVRRVVKQLVDDKKLYFAILGPYKDEEKFTTLL